MPQKTITKIGIADCHGIESYMDKKGNEREVWVLVTRANANRQRHAIAYEVTVPEEIDKKIAFLCRSPKREHQIEALNLLKEKALEIKVMSGTGIKKSWDLIPDPKLDPYRD